VSETDILYEVADGGVATLTINRPERINALRPQTTKEMREAIASAREDDGVRCLLVTGSGRGFCAGDDFQAIFLADNRGDHQTERQIRRIKSGEQSLDDLFALEKPTVAAVNGPAVGYGMDIAIPDGLEDAWRIPAGAGGCPLEDGRPHGRGELVRREARAALQEALTTQSHWPQWKGNPT
jgi:1,4-dihydroxy-2-naphthoyl-CoA synthase